MKYTVSLLALAFSLFMGAQSNNLKETSLSGLKFRNLGPALTSGRIADLAVNPHNHKEYYVAVASGGVWKTSNHGVTYQPVFDDQGSYSIGCVSIDPSNKNIVWVGTGENNNQRSVAYGDGVYKSEDAGKSWKNVGLKNSEHIGMIQVHPKNSEVVYVAAYGPLWSAGGDRGIYKTTDGGDNWERILHVSEHTGFNEIHMDPRNPDIMYAAAHQRRRHVWTYVSGGPETAIYKSTDGGKNWKKLENGIPAGDKGRIGLAVHPANPDVVYAMIEGHGMYRSDDRGASFAFQNDYYSSGNYYVELVPHPTDLNTVYSMDTYLQVTNDGGKSWERMPRESRHVDDHCLWINPEDPSQMIVGSDGGLYETYDKGDNWHFKPNLPVTQFYRVSVDNEEPFYNVYGGTQDNFSLGGPSRTINSRGVVNSDWFVTNTGDGFESQIDPVNPDIVYAQAQYGWLVRYDRKSGEKLGIKPYPGKDEPAYRWNWDAPLLISPHDHKTLYFAANKVFKSTNQGNSWTEISDDLTQQIDRHTIPVMGKVQSADAIAYDKSTSQYGNIVALDESPLKEGLLYIGTDDGLIQITDDGGEKWTRQGSFSGVPKNTYVNQVLASLHDENTVFAVFNNHKNGDFTAYILRSSNKGRSWSSIVGNLPDKGAVYSLKQDHENKELLFAGTEYGVYFTTDGGKNWKQLKAGIPTIAIRDMEIQRRENDLVVASFGRGFYVLDDYSPLREISSKTLEKESHIFDIKNALVFMEAQPLGYGKTGFMGASYFTADNPPTGAVITYYLKEAPKSLKKQRQEKEKEIIKAGGALQYPDIEFLRAEDLEEKNYLLFIIRDSEGNEINRFTESPSAGVNRVTWDGTYSSVTSLSEKGEPMTKAGRANLSIPGEYSASMYMSEDGKLRQLGESKNFRLNWLEQHTLQAQNREELLTFQRTAENLRRKVNAMAAYQKEMQSKIGKLKAAARNTPGIELRLMDSLRSLEYDMARLDVKLRGDKTLSTREFETPPSVLDRMNSVTWNSYSSTSAPTGTQRENLDIVKEEAAELREQLARLAKRVTALQRQLEDAGAPYLGDTLPPSITTPE